MRRTANKGSKEPARNGLALYVVVAVALGLLWLERLSKMTPTDHTIALFGIVLAVFAVTLAWLSGQGGI